MFAIVAGCGFIALAIRWLLDLGVTASGVAFLVVPWVLGSLGGIVVMRRLGRSSVIGGILGGGCGAMLCLFIDMFRTLGWSPWPIEQLVLIFAFTMCGGGLLAGIIAVVLDGLSIRGGENVRR